MAASHYDFAPFRFDGEDRVLFRDGRPIPLPPKVAETLALLLDRAGHIVEKDELLRQIWPDTFVEEASLTQNVSLLRKALGESPEEHHYIETIPKRGYRFVAPVERVSGEAVSKPPRRNMWLWSVAAVLLVLLGVTWLLQSRLAKPVRPTGPVTQTIAVLPFVPLGTSEEDQYLGLSVADALITKLANIRQITVRPTSSVRKYFGDKKRPGPVAAGRELEADSVLEGNIQRSGERIRVTVQLIRVSDGVPLWTGTFDERFTDIFEVQDSISDQVTGALALSLTSRERARLKKRDTTNVEAYEAYLKGRFYWNKRTEEGLKRGVEHFTRAIELDPLYALAYAGMADCYNLFNNYDLAPATETGPKAKAAALKALEIDPELAEAHTSLALVREVYDFDQIAAEQSYRRAIELNPNYSTAHHWRGLFLVQMGKTDEALTELRRAKELDPLSNPISVGLAWAHYFARQYDQSIALSKQHIDLAPDFWPAHLVLGWACAQKQMEPEARAAFERAIELSGRSTLPLASLAHLEASTGKTAAAMRILEELNQRSGQRYVSSYFPAAIYAGLGQNDQALAGLESAHRERAYWLISIHVNPWFDGLRQDARFQDLERRLGFTAFHQRFGASESTQ